MTKEELAKKKGLKFKKDNISPVESILNSANKNVSEPVISENKSESKELPSETEKVLKDENIEVFKPIKRGVGKPKKRKNGDKKISFWMDEKYVDKVYSSLSYGDTVNEFINMAIGNYLENKK